MNFIDKSNVDETNIWCMNKYKTNLYVFDLSMSSKLSEQNIFKFCKEIVIFKLFFKAVNPVLFRHFADSQNSTVHSLLSTNCFAHEITAQKHSKNRLNGS